MGMVYSDDIELTKQIRAGGMQAFTVLYEQYHGYLYHFSLKFLKSPEMAEEVVHDVFLKVWENRKGLDPTQSLKGYLIKICKNHVLNLAARALREQVWKNQVQSAFVPLHSDTEDAVLLSDYERLAEEAISQLPARRQKIYRMYRIQEMSLDEIAMITGISKGTVKDHLLKAHRQLRDFIRQYSGISMGMWLLVLFLGE